MAKIKNVPPSKWEEVERIKQRWLNEEQTHQYSDQEILDAVNRVLKRVKIDRPAFVVSCPYEAQLYSTLLSFLLRESECNMSISALHKEDSLRRAVYQQLVSKIERQLCKSSVGELWEHIIQVDFQFDASLHAIIDHELGNTIRPQLWNKLLKAADLKCCHELISVWGDLADRLSAEFTNKSRDGLEDALWNHPVESRRIFINDVREQLTANSKNALHKHKVLGDLLDSLFDELDQKVSNQLYHFKLHFYNGLYLNSWAGYFEAAKAIGVKFDQEEYNLYMEFNRRCPIWLWDDRCIYILRRPKEIHWGENGLLDNKSGPAVVFSEHFNLWSIGGVSVDEQIVMRPETQTIKQIQSEQNEEVKRVRIEQYGWMKYLQDAKARVIDKPRRNDIENTTETLMECAGQKVLICACPSTAKVFALEVPPDIQTCDAAQSWLHGGASIDDLIGQTRVIGRS